MPLDELIQSWATFAHATTCHAGLSAASAAFAALSAETAARHAACRSLAALVAPVGLPDSVYSALDQARQCWLEALDYLHCLHCLRACAPDDEAVSLAAPLCAQSLRHSQRLLAIYARLWHEAAEADEATCPLRRIHLGPLSLPEEQAAPEQEAGPC